MRVGQIVSVPCFGRNMQVLQLSEISGASVVKLKDLHNDNMVWVEVRHVDYSKSDELSGDEA